MTGNITSDAHINAIAAAIANLVDEYETLDGKVSVPAQGRRATAMERVCAASFSAVTDDLDPYNMDDLSANVAEATLEYSLFVTDLMVTAMLDFRQKTRDHHHRPGSYRDRLRGMLLDIWLMALEELKEDGDSSEEADSQNQEPGNAGDDGDADEAGEWCNRAA